MTIDIVLAAIVPPRPALWTAPITALWIWLIHWQPAYLEGGLPALAVRPMVHGLIAIGLWLGRESADQLSLPAIGGSGRARILLTNR